MAMHAFSPVVETEEDFVCFGRATIIHPQSIHLVIDVYLGHVPTLDPKIINFLAFHS